MDFSVIKNRLFSALSTATGLPVFDTAVPAGTKPPFLRFYALASELSREFEGRASFRRHVFVVDVVSSSAVATEAETVLNTVISTLNGIAFSDNAGNRYKARVIGVRKLHDEDTKLWLLSAEFSIHVQSPS